MLSRSRQIAIEKAIMARMKAYGGTSCKTNCHDCENLDDCADDFKLACSDRNAQVRGGFKLLSLIFCDVYEEVFEQGKTPPGQLNIKFKRSTVK